MTTQKEALEVLNIVLASWVVIMYGGMMGSIVAEAIMKFIKRRNHEKNNRRPDNR